MREFLFDSDEIIDNDALEYLKRKEKSYLIPCSKIRFNSKIKLAFFLDGLTSLGNRIPKCSVDELSAFGIRLLDIVMEMENEELPVALENLVLDQDGIYLDEQGQLHCLCMPTVLPEDYSTHPIYPKRVYALLEEMLKPCEGGENVVRQIAYQQEKDFGNWKGLQDALTRRQAEEDDNIVLRSINAPAALAFTIGHEKFRIGSDPEQADGLVEDADNISPVHAVVTWNDISFCVMDLDSASGTYLNDQRIPSMVPIPIGKGNVLRFADYTFNVE